MRNKRKEEGQKGSGFMVLYTTLMMLLMTFFIVLVYQGTVEEQKLKVGMLAFREYLLSGGVGILLGGKQPLSFDYLIKREKMKIKMKMSASLKKALSEEKEFEIFTTKEGVVLKLPGKVLFDTGKAELKPKAKTLLNKVAPLFKQYPYPVRVEGHTDNVPIHTEKYPSNWELSAARAVNVVRYLQGKGLSKEKVFAVGYGEYRPLVSNDTPEHRALNRRVEIVITVPHI